MAQVTLRVLAGADRGRLYEDLSPPITIGREEGNSVQLNDERISRFHVKIQEDADKFVLTDLESTNGSKVNGEDTQIRILRHGDVIQVGRSLLLFGSREEIDQRLATLRGIEASDSVTLTAGQLADKIEAAALDDELEWDEDPDMQSTLHTLIPPDLPENLTPSQAAQLTELVEYFHYRLRDLILSVKIQASDEDVAINQRQWQNLLDLQAQIVTYIRRIAEPETEA